MKDEKQNQVRVREKMKAFRRELRANLTPAEAKLWAYLQKKQLDGRKFRRQHSIGGFILDFYCHSERLAVELDGQVHYRLDAQEYDHKRDSYLRGLGIQVLRFENKIVFQNPEWLLKQIRAAFGPKSGFAQCSGQGGQGNRNPSGLRPPLPGTRNINPSLPSPVGQGILTPPAFGHLPFRKKGRN